MQPDPIDRAQARRLRRRELARRRRSSAAIALAGFACIAFAAGLLVGGGLVYGGADDARRRPPPPELPRGGRKLLPAHRLVGFYGAPQSAELGALGIGTPAQVGNRLVDRAKAYRGSRPVLPVFELLASIAASDPGPDGSYRLRQPHSVIRRYLAQARRSRGLLLLDVQPGRADFAAEIGRLKRYLREPDVGLALDPEWHVGSDEIPGQVIGSVDAEAVNEISGHLAAIVKRHDLPEKLFVIHQFTEDMIVDRPQLRDRPGLATVINADGFGDPANKIAKYRTLRPDRDSGLGARLQALLQRGHRPDAPAGGAEAASSPRSDRLRVAPPEATPWSWVRWL